MKIHPSLAAALALALGACLPHTDPVGPTDGVVRLVNLSSVNIDAVYITGCTSQGRGGNRLQGIMTPRTHREFKMAPGCYDVVAEGVRAGFASAAQRVELEARERVDVQVRD